jgi:hypothetical protein
MAEPQTTHRCVHRYIKAGQLLVAPNTYEAICADCGKVLGDGWTPPDDNWIEPIDMGAQ